VGGCRAVAGRRGAELFGVAVVATASILQRGDRAVVLTRMAGRVDCESTILSAGPEAALSITLYLRALRRHELRVAGRLVHSGATPAHAVGAFSLTQDHRATVSGDFDAVHLRVPQAIFDEIADGAGRSPPKSLLRSPAEPDPVASLLATLLVPALCEPDPAKAMFVEHVALAFLAHAAATYGEAARDIGPSRSGLAPWQERRAKEMMQAAYATPLTVTEVSQACRLSPSYFGAAFRRSTGQSPHRYLLQIRIAEAKRLMLSSEIPLAEVALASGFGDQSYFTRVFRNLVGASPGQWKRDQGGTHPVAVFHA
jgi:AraC-like DNA-binding protein